MNASDAVKQIKSVKPDRLVIHDRDGQTVPVVLSQLGRQRWQRLEEMLDSRAWVRIECTTTKGELLREVVADHAAPREEADELVTVDDAIGDVERLTKIMLRVQERAMGLQSSQIDRAMGAFEKMANIMADAMIAVRDSYEMAMKMQATALAANAAGGDGELDQSMMQMFQMAMALKGMPSFGPKPAPPPRPGPKTTTPPPKPAGAPETKAA